MGELQRQCMTARRVVTGATHTSKNEIDSIFIEQWLHCLLKALHLLFHPQSLASNNPPITRTIAKLRHHRRYKQQDSRLFEGPCLLYKYLAALHTLDTAGQSCCIAPSCQESPYPWGEGTSRVPVSPGGGNVESPRIPRGRECRESYIPRGRECRESPYP